MGSDISLIVDFLLKENQLYMNINESLKTLTELNEENYGVWAKAIRYQKECNDKVGKTGDEKAKILDKHQIIHLTEETVENFTEDSELRDTLAALITQQRQLLTEILERQEIVKEKMYGLRNSTKQKINQVNKSELVYSAYGKTERAPLFIDKNT
jgi:hypothetical protein